MEWALLKSIYDASPDAITYIDQSGRIVLFNRAAEILTGYSIEEIRMIPMVELYPNADDFGRIWKQVEAEGKCIGVETTIRNRSSELIPISLSVAEVRDEEGVMIGTVGISRDLRTIRNLQNQIRHLETAATRMALASQTAHEINNPLEIIKNYVYLIESGTADPLTIERLGIIRREWVRIAGIVRSLTGMALQPILPQDAIDVRAFIHDYRDLVIPWMISRGIDLIVRIPESLPTLHASVEHLRQVFLNLTLFVVRVMPAGGVFEIRVEVDTDDLIFSFRSGCEESMEDPHPIRTTHPAPESQQEIDLSISHGLVGNLGGALTVSAHSSGGSELRIRLPLGKGE